MSQPESTAKPLKCDECGHEIEGWLVVRNTDEGVETLCIKCYKKKYGGRVAG